MMGRGQGLITAEEFIKKNNLGEDVPSRTIARALLEKYPNIYTSVDSARDCVRKLRGNMGSEKRSYNNADKGLFRANRSPEVVGREYNLIPIKTGLPDYIFPYKKPLILSDIHLPFHNLEAIMVATDKGAEMGVDSIYLNGDILDCYKISRFLKEGGMPSFQEEREMFFQLIDFLEDSLNVPIIYKGANHEARLEHYIQQNAPAFEDVPDLKLNKLLKLDELKIGYVHESVKCIMGKLIVIHGHEFGKTMFSPVNAARGLFLRAKSSCLMGHCHSTSSHHENNLKGDPMACFSTGALCDLAPRYLPFAATKWNLGFAVVEIEDSGEFTVDNFRVVNGKAR